MIPSAPNPGRYFRHMTKRRGGERTGEAERRCRWCGRRLASDATVGRPRQYCRQGCRQSAYLARRLAAAHGLGDDDLVISRTALEELQSRLYVLQAAIEDVDRDLSASREPNDIAEALDWLLENARPVAELWIEPRGLDPSASPEPT